MKDETPTNNMVRTNIYLTGPQITYLRKKSGGSGLHVAEIVRRAIDDYIDKDKTKCT